MQSAPLSSDAYLEAFMDGFEFVLLAIRGRLAEPGVPASERARLEGFLADYGRIVAKYHERDASPKVGLAIDGPFRAEISSVAAN